MAKNSTSKKPAPKPATAAALKKGDHVFLVDGSSYIFRAYHALPPLNRKSDGLQVNAVLGFCNMLWKLLRDMKPEERPTHLAVVFDKSEKTFRTEMYSEYKANRTEPPDDLRPQFPLIRAAVRAFELPCLEQIGFEADDLIATYVRQACEAGASATIVASDKDLMQLVNDCVVMYDTMKDRRIGIPEVIEKFGVPPQKMIEVQALIGDSTDNVPGVPGIGVKTAAQLIGEYGDLETLLARAGEIKQEKRRQALIDNAERARLSKKLVTLDANVALEVPLAELAVHEPDYKQLVAFLKAMEFAALTRRVAEFSGIDAGEIEPDGKLKAGPAAARDGGERRGDGGDGSLFAGEIAPDQIEQRAALEAMKPLLEDPGVLKVGQDIKFDLQMFALRGIDLAPYDDVMLMSYVLDAGRAGHALAALSQRYLDHAAIDFNQLTGSGKSKLTFDCVAVEKAAEYAAENADATLRLWQLLKPRLTSEHVVSVYETLERPLAAVRDRMQRRRR